MDDFQKTQFEKEISIIVVRQDLFFTRHMKGINAFTVIFTVATAVSQMNDLKNDI